MSESTFKIDERFKKRVQARYEKYDVQGGILVDKPHRNPRPAKRNADGVMKKVRAQQPKTEKTNRKKTVQKKKKKTFSQRVKGKVSKLKAKTKAGRAKAAAKAAERMRADHRSRGLGTLEGGPVRLMKNSTYSTNAEIGEKIRKEHGVPWLTDPIHKYNSKEMKELRKALYDLWTGKNKNYSAVEAKFRAVLRIPILRQRYGRNSEATARNKTFNRFLFDTGQFYKAIIAKIRVRKGS